MMEILTILKQKIFILGSSAATKLSSLHTHTHTQTLQFPWKGLITFLTQCFVGLVPLAAQHNDK